MKLDLEKYQDFKNFQKVSKRFLSYDQRIEFLRLMAEKKWDIKYKTPYATKRKRKHRSMVACQVCFLVRSYYQHHIVLLKNGGPDASWNRIPICDTCHAEIHPWLKI